MHQLLKFKPRPHRVLRVLRLQDDPDDWGLRAALNKVLVTAGKEQFQSDIWRVLSAILHLGNIKVCLWFGCYDFSRCHSR